ncbi:unnamed protein product [Amaranthus hypochondriacus]
MERLCVIKFNECKEQSKKDLAHIQEEHVALMRLLKCQQEPADGLPTTAWSEEMEQGFCCASLLDVCPSVFSWINAVGTKDEIFKHEERKQHAHVNHSGGTRRYASSC